MDTNRLVRQPAPHAFDGLFPPVRGVLPHDIGKQDVGFVAVWLNYRF
jgi:hypothetical protein